MLLARKSAIVTSESVSLSLAESQIHALLPLVFCVDLGAKEKNPKLLLKLITLPKPVTL